MAVVSQPFDRAAACSAPGQLDSTLNEFWEEDPWTIAMKHNLSSFERNRTFLNLGETRFADISYLTGTDTDGDGRSVVAADFSCNGKMDLLVRQVGGGTLLFFENNFPTRHYLKVSLRGDESNKLGIGARLTAVTDEQTLTRELYPENTFHSQAASFVHFGLGESSVIKRLEVRWPNGKRTTHNDVPVDRHVVIDEATGHIHTVTPGLGLDADKDSTDEQ